MTEMNFENVILEKIHARKQSAGGLLSEYANPELRKEEESAWEKAVEENIIL